jgi:hypothetical protein
MSCCPRLEAGGCGGGGGLDAIGDISLPILLRSSPSKVRASDWGIVVVYTVSSSLVADILAASSGLRWAVAESEGGRTKAVATPLVLKHNTWNTCICVGALFD